MRIAISLVVLFFASSLDAKTKAKAKPAAKPAPAAAAPSQPKPAAEPEHAAESHMAAEPERDSVARAPEREAPSSKPQLHLAGDGALVLPLGNWGDVAGIGIGVLGRAEYPLRPEITLTGRLGYIYHLSKSVGPFDISTRELPILAGGKYLFLHGPNRPYAAAELGLVFLTASIGSASNTETKFGMTLGGGYQMGLLDFRGMLFFPSLGDIGDVTGFMVTVGYDFYQVEI